MGEVAAVVPAAGSGSRMETELKKQFLTLAGVPVLGRALRIIEACRSVGSIVIVVGPGDEAHCAAIARELGLSKITAIIPGGKERQDSVYHGLLALSGRTGTVVIHDGARPLLGVKELDGVIKAAREQGAATTAVPVKDTVKLAGKDGFVSRTLPRSRIWLTQTPQAFRYEIILEAHRRARERNFTGTDDAGLVEQLGLPVKLVPGTYENIKLTTPEDLILAEAIIKARRE